MESNRDLDSLDSFSRSRALALAYAVSALEFLGELMPLERLKFIGGIGNHQEERDYRHRMIFEIGFWPNYPVKARSVETIVATVVITCADKAHMLKSDGSSISHPWDGDHHLTVEYQLSVEERRLVLDCAGRSVGHSHHWTIREDKVLSHKEAEDARLDEAFS